MNSKEIAFKSTYPLLDSFYSSLVLNKIFKPRSYNKKYFKDKNICKVNAIPGSLLILDVKKFFECGLYDENVFLYHEEMILSKKFQMMGFESYVLLNETYDHFHSVTVNKTYKSAVRLKKIVLNSHKYYLKNYCKKSWLAVLFLKLIEPLIILEYFLWVKIKKIRLELKKWR